MNYRLFFKEQKFSIGEHTILLPREESLTPLASFVVGAADVDLSRHVARVVCPSGMDEDIKKLTLTAAVRAGARHPGILDTDLAQLHKAAHSDGFVELFADLNALTTGCLMQLVQSLGRRVGRVVVSSTSMDVLHEYHSLHLRGADGRKRAEMVRALRVLDDLRHEAPVHIHQLPPGTTRYYTRGAAQPKGSQLKEGGHEGDFFISEDRQMVAAFWDYQNRDNPRVPVFLVTSDLSLAHVCAAERAAFIYVRTPIECWSQPSETISPETLWFDPFALTLRYSLPHALLWELCLIFGDIRVSLPASRDVASSSALVLRHEVRKQRPGEEDDVNVSISDKPWVPQSRIGRSQRRTAVTATPSTDRKLKLGIKSILSILPTRAGQHNPLQMFTARDEDAVRQLRQVGQLTRLFNVEAEEVVASTDLDHLLDALGKGDYLAVNAIFARHPSYAKVVEDAAQHGRFPSSKVAGTGTGWAIVLGGAYKTMNGVLFGLAEVSDEQFEQAIVRLHRELGDGQPAVPLPRILDRTCMVLRISPIRFEVMLNQGLGRGALAAYEAQRATVETTSIPAHEVIVSPSSALPESYVRQFEPGKGIRLRRSLVSSLVRRSGGG